jgi:hypothetical protein
MAIDTSPGVAVRPASVSASAEDAARTRVGHPSEQLETVENEVSEEEINYPVGLKLWLTVASLCITMFLKGLVSSLGVTA